MFSHGLLPFLRETQREIAILKDSYCLNVLSVVLLLELAVYCNVNVVPIFNM